jgi:hypothetical protein
MLLKSALWSHDCIVHCSALRFPPFVLMDWVDFATRQEGDQCAIVAQVVGIPHPACEFGFFGRKVERGWSLGGSSSGRMVSEIMERTAERTHIYGLYPSVIVVRHELLAFSSQHTLS